jgi:hypothetical protein
MALRAWIAAGLITTAGAAAQEVSQDAAGIVGQAIEASASTSSTSATVAPVVRWDGQPVPADDDVRGLNDTSRDSIETWRRFAERRGYRVDLDESQRVLVISSAERFGSFASSERVIERTLEQMEPFTGMGSEGPLVVLRAMESGDAEDAITGADLLEVNHRLEVFEETGTRRDVRAVDARLAEAICRAHTAEHQPFLSDWMADGLASLMAAEVTGRAIVDGEAVSLRDVRSSVARAHKKDHDKELDISAIGGRITGTGLQEAEAMVVLSYLTDDLRQDIVMELGQQGQPQVVAKSSQETEVFTYHIGRTGLRDMQQSLKRGK